MARRSVFPGGVLVITWALTATSSCSSQSDGSARSPITQGGGSGSGGFVAAGGAQLGSGGAPPAMGGSSPILVGVGVPGSAEDGAGGTHEEIQDAAAVPRPLVLCQTAEGGRAAGRDAGDGLPDETCVPPPSACADDRTLAYFTDGRCVAGRCVWTAELQPCPAGCTVNGCLGNRTLPQ